MEPSRLPNGYLFSGKCRQEKYFSDPLPPGVTRDRINSLFTAPTEKGVQTKESFKLFLRVSTTTIATQGPSASLVKEISMQKSQNF
jgi:hypothetical protein